MTLELISLTDSPAKYPILVQIISPSGGSSNLTHNYIVHKVFTAIIVLGLNFYQFCMMFFKLVFLCHFYLLCT